MRTKYGKFYADWRDESGKRHMKAFPTQELAEKHSRKMRRAAIKRKCQSSEQSSHNSGEGGADSALTEFRKALFKELRKLIRPAIAQAKKGEPTLLCILIALR